MALSPWHVASRLSLDGIAALLSGFDIALVKSGNIHDHEIKRYEEWRRVIATAAKDGDLKPWSVDVLVAESQPDPNPDIDPETGFERFGYVVTGYHWRYRNPEDPTWKNELIKNLELVFERQEVYRWLESSGITNDDMPEALRVMPIREPKCENIHPKREGTYHRIIAALLATQYEKEISEPYALADEVIDDCQARAIKAPASRSTLGELFTQLPPVQKANPD